MKFIILNILLLVLIYPIYSQPILINEFLAVNDKTIEDDFNEFNDWIEIYNNTGETVNLHGYYITDDFSDETKFMLFGTNNELNIEAGGFLILWADGMPERGPRHVNFKLSGSGEEIGLYSAALTLIDSVRFGQQQTDISMGRDINNFEKWGFYKSPTPGFSNSTEQKMGTAPPPQFDLQGGIYTSPIQVSLASDQSGDIICYTLDNTTPESTDIVYDGPIAITNNTVIRAVTYREGYYTSDVISNLYIFNVDYSVSVFAMISDPDYFFGEEGIYSNPYEEGEEWERFCQIQYCINGEKQFSSNAGMRIQGGNSVGMAKKSFRLFFKSEYGNSKLEYPIFGADNLPEFDNLIIKAGYDDDITTSTGTLLRDVLSAELWGRIGGLTTSSNWAHLYLNDEYWGLYNIRESINEQFIRDKTGLEDFDLVRYSRDGAELKYGTLNDWNNLVRLTETLDFTDSATFAIIAQEIDMDYFVNLVAFIQCSQYRTWTWGASAYKENYVDGRWRWTIWDTDRSYTELNWNGFLKAQDLSGIYWGNFLLKKLLKNDEFNQKLINRICDLLNTMFIPENAISVFDSLYNIIKPEMPLEFDRWNPGNTKWESNVQKVRNFIEDRPATIRNQILDWFSLESFNTLNLEIQGEGSIQVNGIEISNPNWNGIYFKDNPIQLTAIPKPGFIFEAWENVEIDTSSFSLNLIDDTSIKAIFILDTNVNNYKIIINEICYQAPLNHFSDDWIEFYNPNPVAMDISGWIFKDQDDLHSFIIPENTIIKTKDYLVIAEDLGTFKSAYPFIDNVIGSFRLTESGFGLSINDDMVRLYNADNVLIDSVWYSNGYPWPVINENPGGSIQLTDFNSNNELPKNWKFSELNLATPGIKNKFDTVTGNPLFIENIQSANLSQNYPNPFNPETTIKYQIPAASYVKLSVYNIQGQKVSTLVSEKQNAGIHEIIWNASGIANGVYFYKLETGDGFVKSRKLILLK